MSLEWIIKIISENGPMFIRGAGVTLLISMVGTILGSALGLLIGVVRTIPMPDKGTKRGILKVVNVILSVYIED